MRETKSCIIIYGYDSNFIYDSDEKIILIEPRLNLIDDIKKQHPNSQNFQLLVKCLIDKKTNGESVMFSYNGRYYIDSTSLNGTQLKDYKRHNVYGLSLCDIIRTYGIQNIKELRINIDINNIIDVLDSIRFFNQIISTITLPSDPTTYKVPSGLTLRNFVGTKNEEDRKWIFKHKNLSIEHPKIVMYNMASQIPKGDILDKMTLLVKQHDISVFCNGKTHTPSNFKDTHCTIVNKKAFKVLFHEQLIGHLDDFFKYELETDEKSEVVVQFNSDFLGDKDTFQVLYPLKDNTLYVDRTFDIIYGTKACMYMLYQILKSKYFTDWMDSRKEEKQKLFPFFAKRYFYDYIYKSFTIHDLNESLRVTAVGVD